MLPMAVILLDLTGAADQRSEPTGVVTSDYGTRVLSHTGRWTVDSSPIRIAVTNACARLAAPSFW